LRWNSELSLLKLLGKRIVYVFMGDDVRHPFSYQQEAAPFYSEEEAAFILPPDLCERLERIPIASLLRNLRIAELYSDLILSVPCNSGLAVRPYDHLFVPLDLSKYHSQIPGRDIPVVLHAPSNTGAKGTDFLLPVLDRLKFEGVLFELRHIHKAPHEQVVAELMNADVLVDQLFLPLHGKLTVEAMASGCAVATSNREDYEPFPPNRPLWHVYPGNLYHQLKRLLTDKDLRLRLAHKGRLYVDTYHDHVKVAQRITHRLGIDGAEQYDHYPKFYAEWFQLPEGVVLPNDLKRMTARIAQRWGLPEGVDYQDMIRRGLMSADGLERSKPIPRWKSSLNTPESATV
jgi:Glycosyl transferases group 1